MATIQDEAGFQQALQSLDQTQQRRVGAQFVRSCGDLLDDFRIQHALKCAEEPNTAEGELLAAYRGVRSLEVETYTRCGTHVDWTAMAAHHVATGAAACSAPSATLLGDDNIAYRAAMSCRLARNCAMLHAGEEADCAEIPKQYEILAAFLDS